MHFKIAEKVEKIAFLDVRKADIIGRWLRGKIYSKTAFLDIRKSGYHREMIVVER